MCGVAGRAARGSLPATSLDPVWRLLQARGPDGSNWWGASLDAGSVELLHSRLAINDLSEAGDQPIGDETDSLIMVFNGEIYNSPELRRRCEAAGHVFRSTMDGEVILHLWEMEGIQALSSLNGIFALAVVNKRTGEVVLARDPIGVKPMYYAIDRENSLWFASELSILEALGAPLGASDLVALAQFLTFLWIPHPRTPHTGAKSLPPGFALRWTTQSAEAFRYCDPLEPVSEPSSQSDEEFIDEASARFCSAAERQLLSDVPIGLMASGGIDSGLLWWATSSNLDTVYTIRWAAEAGGENLDADAATVASLQDRFGNEVEWLEGNEAQFDTMPPSGDLFADPAYELTRLIAQTARQRGLKVLLSGQGGDELFGGYRRHVVAQILYRARLGKLSAVAAEALLRVSLGRIGVEYLSRLARAASEADPFDGYMQLCTYSSAAERAAALGCQEAEVANDVVWQAHREVFDSLPPHLPFLRRVMNVDLRLYLPGLGLSYVDRAGMEFGVEVRVPWLDLELVRWSLTVPTRLLVRRQQGKWISRVLAERAISRDVAFRSKRGFGAPMSRLATAPPTSARGFRQARYFAMARSLTDRHLGIVGAKSGGNHMSSAEQR